MGAAVLQKSESGTLIGTAAAAETFILIETPQPWIKPALLSEGVPEALRQLLKSLLGPDCGIRVHLIANEQTVQDGGRRILIFRRAASALGGVPAVSARPALIQRYQAWEIQVETAADMAPALQEFLQTPVSMSRQFEWCKRSTQRHLMICTHASHNECCGMLGYPFYQEAIAQIDRFGMTQTVQPWQISHIGGHRFAPTLIDFPQGRYYGCLDHASLSCLLKQRGSIDSLLATYRGWSLLPKPLQVLEAKLLAQYGWDWFDCRVAGKILNRSDTPKQAEVELWFESPKYSLRSHRGLVCGTKLKNYPVEPWLEQGA